MSHPLCSEARLTLLTLRGIPIRLHKSFLLLGSLYLGMESWNGGLSGAINALCGAVERVARNLEDGGGQAPACLLSGGAAALIAPQLNLAVKVVDNLVLEGLALIARGDSTAPAPENT